MKFEFIDVNIEDIENIIPDEDISLLRLQTPFLSDIKLLKASEESEVVGFIITSTNKAFPFSHAINYISVVEKFQHNNNSLRLLKGSLKLYSPNKFEHFNVLLDSMNNKCSHILEKAKFKNIANPILLHYIVEAFRNSEFIQKYDELTAIIPYIVNLKDIKKSNADFEVFFKELALQKNAVDFKNLDEEFTQFFVIKGTILGYIAVQRFENEYLIIQDYYSRKYREAEIAIPALLTSVFHLAAQTQNDNFNLFVFLDDMAQATAMSDIFGQWEENETYQQWIL